MPQATSSLRVSPSGVVLLSRPPVILLCFLPPKLYLLDSLYLAFLLDSGPLRTGVGLLFLLQRQTHRRSRNASSRP